MDTSCGAKSHSGEISARNGPHRSPRLSRERMALFCANSFSRTKAGLNVCVWSTRTKEPRERTRRCRSSASLRDPDSGFSTRIGLPRSMAFLRSCACTAAVAATTMPSMSLRSTAVIQSFDSSAVTFFGARPLEVQTNTTDAELVAAIVLYNAIPQGPVPTRASLRGAELTLIVGVGPRKKPLQAFLQGHLRFVSQLTRRFGNVWASSVWFICRVSVWIIHLINVYSFT